jgi:hypothetical protein
MYVVSGGICTISGVCAASGNACSCVVSVGCAVVGPLVSGGTFLVGSI